MAQKIQAFERDHLIGNQMGMLFYARRDESGRKWAGRLKYGRSMPG